MKNYMKSLYAINKKETDAIIYKFGDGQIYRITLDDFGGNETDFRRWKDLSDNYLHEEDITTCRITRKNVSINCIEETELCCIRSVLEEIEEAEEKDEFSEEVRKIFKSNLTVTQLRRLKMSALLNMSQRGIAIAENVNQKSINESIIAAKNKMKKVLKTPPQNGLKMTVGERAKYYESQERKATEKNNK